MLLRPNTSEPVHPGGSIAHHQCSMGKEIDGATGKLDKSMAVSTLRVPKEHHFR